MTGVTLAAVRKTCLVCAVGAVAVLAAASSSWAARAAVEAGGQACAGVPDGSTQTSPSPGAPCWVAVDPYPFGTDGNPVDPTSPNCTHSLQSCYLIATSMAFRAWNRGLAATTTGTSLNPSPTSPAKNPFGVWLFNGSRWYPDPTFPGAGVCQGNTVLWAGKLDYWLIGTGQNGWAPLCRFDGADFYWEPLPMPLGTVLRLGNPVTGQLPIHGGITSGSCLSWDNCWFFGTEGTVLHWDGNALTDVSPDPPGTWAGTTFTGSQLNAGASGAPVGLATVGTSYVFDLSAGIPLPTRAALGTQLFGFDGTTPDGRRLAGSVLPPNTYLAPPAAVAADQAGDPFGTDPVAASLDPSGRGWLAANPAAWQVGNGIPFLRPDLTARERSPLLPVSTGPGSSTGPDSSCPSWYTEDGLDRFPHTYAPGTLPGSTLWTSISTFPGGVSALAGGQTVSTLSDGTTATEPVLVQASCNGTTTVTHFRVPPSAGSTTAAPADPGGWVEAVAANAPNDGWAATSDGILPGVEIPYQPPELYRFTDGTPPEAPAGDDAETRAIPSQQDQPTYVYQPPPPPRLPPLPRVAKTRNLRPAIARIQRKVERGSGTYTLVLSFEVRRRVVLGLEAYRHKRLIASTGLRRLHPPTGQLRLRLNPKRWPTSLAFSSDTPQIALARPGRTLTGDVTLAATATPIPHRTIKSVQFQYELSGSGYWIVIGNAKARPYRLFFDTNDVANGTYDLRAVATDNRGSTGISRVARGHVIRNGPG
jgi:hypothetical protein